MQNRTKQDIPTVESKCPYCQSKVSHLLNIDEYRIIMCPSCEGIFKVRPRNRQHIYDNDGNKEQFELIYRLHSRDIDGLMHLAVDSNDKEWFEELARIKNSLIGLWYVGTTKQKGVE